MLLELVVEQNEYKLGKHQSNSLRGPIKVGPSRSAMPSMDLAFTLY